jgi:hypothetical protein
MATNEGSSADAPARARVRKARGKASAGEGAALRSTSDPRSERRFEGKSTAAQAIAVLVASLAAVALGAGVHGQWFRGELGSHPYAAYLLIVGGVALGAIALAGPRGTPVVRVGDAGVALEREGSDPTRIAWYEVVTIALDEGALTFGSDGATIAIPLASQPEAAAYALSEARRRVPARAAGLKGDLPSAGDGAGHEIALEPPQVAGLRCRASDQPTTFERDVRLCARCGAVYHRDAVPKRCLACEASLLSP